MRYETTTCPICRKSFERSVYKDEKVSYVMCTTCTLVFLNPRPTAESYAEFYRDSYQKSRHALEDPELVVKKISEKESLKKREPYLRDLRPYLARGARVLEVGTGWGLLLKLLRDAESLDVTGIEISELAVRVAKEKYNLPVTQETFEQFSHRYRGEPFDVIVMTHVLEHFTDLAFVLKRLKEMLGQGGVLYLAVPNVKAPDEPLDRFFHFEHCYYFSPLTLLRLLKPYGFKIIYLNTREGDIRVAVTHAEDPREGIEEQVLESQYSASAVRRSLFVQKIKYALLRVFKLTARAVLPQALFVRLRQAVVAHLKRSGIIRI